MSNELLTKLTRLKEILADMESALVALSGGVDSSLVLRVAVEVLRERVAAVTAISATLAAAELEEAKKITRLLKVRHFIIEADELKSAEFVKNPPERCYFCKKLRFTAFKKLAREHGFKYVVDGSNADDERDWRPGLKANLELSIRSPLREAGLTKADIRVLAKQLNLSNWDKPSAACLASRIPYGSRVTKEKLVQIEKAEALLKKLGIRQLRVRHHGEIARIETNLAEAKIIFDNRRKITSFLKSLGFLYITLDLEGFKSGSLNRSLSHLEDKSLISEGKVS
jgi:uncharacterized protein